MRISTTRILISVLCLAGPVVLGSDPPDSELNPQSGFIETVYIPPGDGDHGIRHVIDEEEAGKVLFDVSTDEPDDLDPKLAISSGGDTWVVWWRDDTTDAVLVRKRSWAESSWEDEWLVGESGESGRNPEIVHDGADPWVVYEFDGTGDRSIAVGSISDDPDPLPNRTVVGTTTYGGDLDVKIHNSVGHLWVTWIHDSTDVGWSEYDYGEEEWSAADYEPYENDSVALARFRIASEIIGN